MLDREQWISQLDACAAMTDHGELALGGLEAAFVAARAGEPARTPHGARLETALWWARADRAAAVGALIDPAASGALLPVDAFMAIEVWTDAELSALHALWWLVHQGRAARDRLVRARDWHLEHTQPDNATARPWAIHVFIEAGRPDHDLYAQTLLHNCLVQDGRPTFLAAEILRDAADALRASP